MDENTIQEIVNMRQAGYSLTQISKKLGLPYVKVTSVYNIYKDKIDPAKIKKPIHHFHKLLIILAQNGCSNSTIAKLLRKSEGQIEKLREYYRKNIESGIHPLS